MYTVQQVVTITINYSNILKTKILKVYFVIVSDIFLIINLTLLLE